MTSALMTSDWMVLAALLCAAIGIGAGAWMIATEARRAREFKRDYDRQFGGAR